VYVVIGLSGLTALGAEVVWTRNLSLLLGGTVYTFSIILAVFLVGLGIGSGIGSVISRHSLRPRLALGVCQLLLMGAIAWAAYALADSLPYWPVNPSLSRNPWINFQLDLMRCVWAVLPGAILWGASFPLASHPWFVVCPSGRLFPGQTEPARPLLKKRRRHCGQARPDRRRRVRGQHGRRDRRGAGLQHDIDPLARPAAVSV
jgi:hypothetical protein